MILSGTGFMSKHPNRRSIPKVGRAIGVLILLIGLLLAAHGLDELRVSSGPNAWYLVVNGTSRSVDDPEAQRVIGGPFENEGLCKDELAQLRTPQLPSCLRLLISDAEKMQTR